MKIKSIIPGRIRIVEPILKKNYKLSTLIELSLMQISGIKNVRSNPINGSIKITYNVHRANSNLILTRINNFLDSKDMNLRGEVFKDYIEERKNLTHASNHLVIYAFSYLFVKIKKYYIGNFYFASSLPILIIAALLTIISDYPLLSRIRKRFNNKVDNFLVYLGLILAFLREGDLTLFLLFIKSLTELFNAYSGLQVKKQFIKNCSIGMQVEKVNKKGEKITLPVSAIKTGDEIIVSKNNLIRFDGSIIEGQALINHVYYKGRCIIEKLGKNDNVKHGMFIVKGEIKIKVSEAVEYVPKDDIELKQMTIYSKANNYQEKQLVIATLLASLGWIISGSIITPLSIYLVMGPAAVDFSVKSGLALYLKKLRDRGIILRNVNKMEKIKNVDIIVFDKTGTLSSDTLFIKEIKVYDNHYTKDDIRDIFNNCENGILHPIAGSIEGKIDDKKIRKKEYITGQGVQAIYQGDEVFVGNQKLMSAHNIKLDKYTDCDSGIKVYIAVNEKLAGEVILGEKINKSIFRMIDKLDKLPIDLAIISGDEKKNINWIADILGTTKYKGNMSYEDKKNYIKNLKKSYNNIIMVGDGINDAAAMREADISVTFKRESVNLRKVWENSDCILRKDDLVLIADLILLSKSTGKQIVMSNSLCSTNNYIFALLTVSGYYNPFQAKAINTLNSIIGFLCNLPIVKLDEPVIERDSGYQE